jgi:hypothetical protein
MTVARAMRPAAIAASLAAAVAATPGRGAAQEQAPPNTTCAGQPITAVTVLNLPPIERPTSNWYEAPARVANSAHAITKPDVVRALMLLSAGDACDRFRLVESERVLRAQPFIADAHIAVVADSGGTVMLVVTTQDEFTFIVGARFSGRSPFVTGFTLGDGNLGGNGISASAFWLHTDTREGFGAAMTDYAFLNRPWQLQLAAGRGGVGEHGYLGDVSHPFYSDAQRDAWRGSFIDAAVLTPFQRADTTPFNVGMERQFISAGAAKRLGRPGSVLLLGGGFSMEYDESGFPASGYDSSVNYGSLLTRYTTNRNVRLNILAEYRRIHFARGNRLGTLNGFQDIRTGLELSTLFGRGLSGIDGSSADLFLASGLFLGVGGGGTYAYLQVAGETRRATASGDWTNGIGSARVVLYRRLGEKQTLITDLEYGGGWATTRPFELRLGQFDGGVRGYADSHDAGGSRIAVKVEDHWFLGSLMNRADVGIAAFVDAGQVWAGDIPFGTTTPVKVGVGVGLLVASPIGSRRTFRLDLAVPVSPDGYAKWQVRFSIVNITQLGAFREPADVAFGREFIGRAMDFTYPR